MKSFGIVSDVMTDDSEPVKFSPEDMAAIGKNGLQIAAWLDTEPSQETLDASGKSAAGSQPVPGVATASEPGAASIGTHAESVPGPTPEAAAIAADAATAAAAGAVVVAEVVSAAGSGTGTPESQPTVTAVSVPAVIAEPVTPAAQAPAVAPASDPIVDAVNEATARLNIQHAADLAGASANLVALQQKHDGTLALLRSVQGERDTAKAEIVKLNSALSEANGQLVRLLGGALSFSQEISSWEDAMKHCKGDYVACRQRFPELYRQFRELQRKGKGKPDAAASASAEKK
jgi:hypothetical protein